MKARVNKKCGKIKVFPYFFISLKYRRFKIKIHLGGVKVRQKFFHVSNNFSPRIIPPGITGKV